MWQNGTPIMEMKEHDGFVNSVAFIPSTEEYPNGLIVSGGSDKLINLYDAIDGRICGTLVGHTDNVCKIRVFEGNSSRPFVMSTCSWDGSARCWTEELIPESCLVLSSSSSSSSNVPCWSVLSLGKDVFVTGHADRNIRIWRGDRVVQTIASAHRDVVRDLYKINNTTDYYLSAGNDGALKVWSASSGKIIQTIEAAHSAFIYGLTGNGEDLIASFGEEGLIKIWRWIGSDDENNRLKEEISLRVPAVSVWSACFLDSKTLLVGTSTGTIYSFSSMHGDDSSAVEEIFSVELAAFDSALHASKSAEIERNALDASVLRYPGERVGKVVLVKRSEREGVLVEAHQWDGLEWQNLGQVIDPSSVKAPDFNFKVELDDTGRSYTLPYSWGENPYAVAKNFLERHDLPISHLDEVANFIIKNAGSPPTNQSNVEEPSLDIKEPDLLVLTAWNAEGVVGKLKQFGMKEIISLESVSEALKSWPVDKLFPCLDWLRMEVLKRDDSVLMMAANDLPLEKIFEKIASDKKEEIATITMTLRLYCNVLSLKSSATTMATTKKTTSFDLASTVKVIGMCTLSLNETNGSAWIPLLIGIIFNGYKQSLLDANKSMALLHGLLNKINQSKLDLKGEDEINRIAWLIKNCGGSKAPLAVAIKKELEVRPNEFSSKMIIFL